MTKVMRLKTLVLGPEGSIIATGGGLFAINESEQFGTAADAAVVRASLPCSYRARLALSRVENEWAGFNAWSSSEGGRGRGRR